MSHTPGLPGTPARRLLAGAAVLSLGLLTACGSDSNSGDSAATTLDVWIMEGTNPDAGPSSPRPASVQGEDRRQDQRPVSAVGHRPDRSSPPPSRAARTRSPTWPRSAPPGPRSSPSRRARRLDRRHRGVGPGRRPRRGPQGRRHARRQALRHALVRGHPLLVYRKDIFENTGSSRRPPGRNSRRRGQDAEGKGARDDPLPGHRRRRDIRRPLHLGRGRRTRHASRAASGSPASTRPRPSGHRVLHRRSPPRTRSTRRPRSTTWTEKEVGDAWDKGQSPWPSAATGPPSHRRRRTRPQGQARRRPDPRPERRHEQVLPRRLLPVHFNTDKKDLAWEFMKMLTTGEFAAKWAERDQLLPRSELRAEEDRGEEGPAGRALRQADAGGRRDRAPGPRRTARSRHRRSSRGMMQSILTGKPPCRKRRTRRPRPWTRSSPRTSRQATARHRERHAAATGPGHRARGNPTSRPPPRKKKLVALAPLAAPRPRPPGPRGPAALAADPGRQALHAGLRPQVRPAEPNYTGSTTTRDLLGSALCGRRSCPTPSFFAVACVGLTVALGTLVALLLNRLGPAWRLICSIAIIAAWAMPAVTGTYVWIWLFQPQDGMVSDVLEPRPDRPRATNWFTDRGPFYAIATLNVVHHGFPFVAITVLAGLMTIPKELYEAGELDGANAWQRFWKITVPTIKPVFLVVTILSTIWDFKVFTQIYLHARRRRRQRESTTSASSPTSRPSPRTTTARARRPRSC